ncbi:SGNH/GDSL hydrolase family protein, partial [bacterium]|nr:SGNH/GDSL hydrolase family protein [bacterium]
VIILGDSIAFGNYLSVESIFPSQIQDKLDKINSSFDIINFAVSGYDTLQEVALLEYRGLEFKPNLVVVAFCLNDIAIVSPNLSFIKFINDKRFKLMKYSYLAQFITRKIDAIIVKKWLEEKNREEVFQQDYKYQIAHINEDENELLGLMSKASNRKPSSWFKSKYRVGRLRYSFEHLAEIAKRENFSVLIVIIPWLERDKKFYPHKAAHDIVNYEAKRDGFDVIDVLQDFLDVGFNKLKISKTDYCHPNKLGHKIISDRIVDYILEKQL